MITDLALALFAAVAVATLAVVALRDQRRLAVQRRGLLDAAADILDSSRIRLSRDGFPMLDGNLSDGRRLRLELIADTLVCRRLPQLWLKLTLTEHSPQNRPSIGALSRPTGAEFYSLVHDLPEWGPPPQSETSILMRSDGTATAAEIDRSGSIFSALFRNPAVKEAVITARGVRLIRQAAEGDRGAHLLLRQVRFPLEQIPADLIRTAIAEARLLSEALPNRDVTTTEMNRSERMGA
ncbi:hypothetical protein [Mesorhizobium retamae]|uniref:Histidine kinase n=1 Tax=Mesorhizobium retamae TaxID=2912854 RepID=A0ABS9QPF2_9HYPH|nr:hypothetical protein [Mesorhizobium sp. IRAMC:0171]MCG7509334.1 hypothetical protein [Mesorhizobium sp. IRAMC:0171]